MIFTHQGASWTGAENRAVLGLAFPAEAANRAALAERLPDAGLRAPVLAYHATESTLAAQISLADIWARAHRVPLYCGEFGVVTRVAPPDSRYRWLASVRRICDERGIGWAMWDYCGGFRLALGDTAGQRRLDPRCLQALGMDSAAEPSP
jgi:endoglucanase